MNDILISYIIADTDKLELYEGDVMGAIDKLEKETRHFYNFSYSNPHPNRDDPWIHDKKLEGWLEWSSGYDLPDAMIDQYVFHGCYGWYHIHQALRTEKGTSSKARPIEEIFETLHYNSGIRYIQIGELNFIWNTE